MLFSEWHRRMCFFKMRNKPKNEDDLGSRRRGIQHKKEALGMLSKVGKGEPRTIAVQQV